MIQVNSEGRIISINAHQDIEGLISVDIDTPEAVLNAPYCYRYLDGQFVEITSKTRLQNPNTESARAYLDATDFYVMRKLETGTAIPQAVIAQRNKARAILADNLPEFEL